MRGTKAQDVALRRQWRETVKHVATELKMAQSDVTRRFLPRWWNADSIESGSHLKEGFLLLASTLQIPAQRIEERLSPLVPPGSLTRCKGSSPEQDEKHLFARQAAEILARNLICMLDIHQQPIRRSAEELRGLLLERNPRITLEGLLQVAWDSNVPVAHLAEAPSPRPHAIATNVDGRCAVVFLRNFRHSGWHLFDLAHELGHIMLGHVSEGESYCESNATDRREAEEVEANEFALMLLTGQKLTVGYHREVSAEKLRSVAVQSSQLYKVDPQWLIVTTGYVWDSNIGWKTVQRALLDGWPDDNGIAKVNAELRNRFRLLETKASRRDSILGLTTPAPKAA
jgi:hypothetical protein